MSNVAWGELNPKSLNNISYGLYALTATEGEKDNGCIVNTVCQVTSTPARITVAVNKQNYTCGMIERTGRFNVNVISEDAPFDLFVRFGFSSGRDGDKFAGFEEAAVSASGLPILTQYVNAFYSAKVIQAVDCGTHMLFLADVTEGRTLSDVPSATYAYYHANIKPKKKADAGESKYVCRICGYEYKGESLPEDFVCPICKHGAADFEKA